MVTMKLTYRILTSVGEEKPKGNLGFHQLEQLVNDHISEGWRPVGGVTITSVGD